MEKDGSELDIQKDYSKLITNNIIIKHYVQGMSRFLILWIIKLPSESVRVIRVKGIVLNAESERLRWIPTMTNGIGFSVAASYNFPEIAKESITSPVEKENTYPSNGTFSL